MTQKTYKRQQKWSKNNMKIVCCKLKKDDFLSFKNACYDRGYSVHATIRLLIAWYLGASSMPMSYSLQNSLDDELAKKPYNSCIPHATL